MFISSRFKHCSVPIWVTPLFIRLRSVFLLWRQIICSPVFSVVRVFIHICTNVVLNFRIVYLQSSRHRRRRVPVSPPIVTRPLHSSRPLPTPRAQQQHQHDQYTSAAAPRFAATAATTTTLLAFSKRAAALRPRSEVRSLYIPRRVHTPPARRFVSGGRPNDRRLVVIQHILYNQAYV